MRRFDRSLPSMEATSSRRTRAGQFSQYVKDPGAWGPQRKNSPGNVSGSFKFLSFVIKAAVGVSFHHILCSRRNRAGNSKYGEKGREREKGRGRSRCAGGRETRERERPGWRRGGTRSTKRDDNMRDTLRSPTVRLIRSGLPWNV